MRGKGYEMDKEKARAVEILLLGSFSVTMNMNDTFAFACADAEDFDLDDLDLMVPVINRYGAHALTAYAAVKRGAEPIHCPCGHDGPDYEAAKQEIMELKKKNRYFMG